MKRSKLWARMALAAVIGYAALLALMPEADAFDIIKLDSLSVEYRKIDKSARDPLFYNSTPKESVDLVMNMDILRYFFWDNRVHSMTNSAKYEMVGWNPTLGLRLLETKSGVGLEVLYEHYSKHLLDDVYPYQKFPVQDSIGFNLYIYRARPGRPAVF
jgi:hypothetical protein